MYVDNSKTEPRGFFGGSARGWRSPASRIFRAMSMTLLIISFRTPNKDCFGRAAENHQASGPCSLILQNHARPM
jgi:hypothetical protein